MQIDVATARRRLAAVWLIPGGLFYALLAAGSIADRYAAATSDVWSWAVPTLMPTLSLVIGVLVLKGKSPSTRKTVDRFAYILALGASLLYLGLVLATLLAPIAIGLPILSVLERSNLWLAPFQGIATGCLGAFYARQEA